MKKALLVGINKYAMGCNLAGCVNDVKGMASMVVSHYGFEPENVRMILNERATTQSIRKRLYWLVQEATAGDVLLFHYSGHGAQDVTRNDSGEIDGLDEVLCPYDFDWTPSNMIRDKELVSIFSKIPNGVQFNWLSDSCHSGDMTRTIVSRDLARNFPNMPDDIKWHINAAKSKGLEVNRPDSVMNVGYLSGCGEKQTSADTEIDGIPCGAMTAYFTKALRDNPNISMCDMAMLLCQRLEHDGYSQRPQAEGIQIYEPFLGGVK
jgi:hypothetical protein